ncbi:MAG: phosphotransferase enzyme family protein [Lachnospiraceae bacterium]
MSELSLIDEVISHLRLGGILLKKEVYGSGHINDTYLLEFEVFQMGSIRVILQKMNSDIFRYPEKLMENIVGVTTHLRKKIIDQGGDPERETLNVIPTIDGKNFYVDSKGGYWRAYKFITGATSFDKVERVNDFYEAAVAFGRFQNLLADYNAESLHETIIGFHDTIWRFDQLLEAIKEDKMKRVLHVEKETEFAMQRKQMTLLFPELLKKKEIPLRVTHNDTKLNNIMIDDKSRKGICVIDLDTVMPGLAMFDFGDSIRFGASSAAEDEVDLDKVWCDLELFELYVKGYMKGCEGKLTRREIELMPMGAIVMTFECGMRFLTDYLNGDQYFKVHRENHNLDRCRTQFKLVSDMEHKWDEMCAIISKYNK